MPTLLRTVRFCLNDGVGGVPRGPNSFAASPGMSGLGRFYELHVACHGEVHPTTGYLINIQEIDAAVRRSALPTIEKACRETPAAQPESLMPSICRALADGIGPMFASVRWSLTPYYSLEMSIADTTTVLIRQQFDFAASHRLHSPMLSEEENRALFGKCNNATGHGHNYRVEPTVAVPIDAEPRFTLSDLESLVQGRIIERFDHKNLNLDVREFATEGGLNPSVENIARVCHELLAPSIAEHPSGATLRSVTVWETDRTSSTYPG